jgi:hypothetical protein
MIKLQPEGPRGFEPLTLSQASGFAGYVEFAIMLSGVSGMVRQGTWIDGIGSRPNHFGYTAIELNR